ncbi:hypothetical protein [Streptomyces gardneri]|uniref:hypothetical protein n=1 Tax=Streptomyces gardneri TaxID=66892 RepID=UPI0037D59FB0
MKTYETSEEARAAPALLHDYTEVDALLSEVVPLVLELAYLTASARVTDNRYDGDRVDVWIAARTHTAQAAAPAP